jgi:hypothetical protein
VDLEGNQSIKNFPQVMKIAKEINFDLNSEQAKDIASRVTSISLTAIK